MKPNKYFRGVFLMLVALGGCWVTCFGVGSGEDEKISGIRMFPFYKILRVDDSFRELHLTVAFSNCSESPVTLPTQGASFSMGQRYIGDRKEERMYRRSVQQDFHFDEFLNVANIVSRESFQPVILEPGETTVVQFDVRVDREWPLNEVQFEFRVWKDVGERYGFWTGRVRAALLEETSAGRKKFYEASGIKRQP